MAEWACRQIGQALWAVVSRLPPFGFGDGGAGFVENLSPIATSPLCRLGSFEPVNTLPQRFEQFRVGVASTDGESGVGFLSWSVMVGDIARHINNAPACEHCTRIIHTVYAPMRQSAVGVDWVHRPRRWGMTGNLSRASFGFVFVIFHIIILGKVLAESLEVF